MADNFEHPREFLREFWEDEEDHDIWFLVDGKRIGASRAIMARNGPFFRTLLEGQFKESKQVEIHINSQDGDFLNRERITECVSADTFELIVQFCFKLEINLNALSIEQLEALHKAACQYFLDRLLFGIANYVKETVTYESLFNWIKAAATTNGQYLEKALKDKLSDLNRTCKFLLNIWN